MVTGTLQCGQVSLKCIPHELRPEPGQTNNWNHVTSIFGTYFFKEITESHTLET